jgi:lysophospholipase L1-like esterase
MFAVKVLLVAMMAWSAAGSSVSRVMKTARATRNLRIAWMGTSITCGLGASTESQRFTVQVNKLFERQTGAKIVSRNFCFGGAHSLLQVALLKTSVLPWKPDLVIAELGTLDELYRSISLPAIEAFLRIAYGARTPVIALYPYTNYSDVARDGLHKLGASYGDDVIDMVAYDSKRGAALNMITNDGCHPNDKGQALIVDAFEERLKSGAGEVNRADSPPKRMYTPDLSGVSLQPISLDAGAERLTPRLFDGQGFALKISAEMTITQKFRGWLIGLLFQFNATPEKISYRIDDGGWSDVQISPEWFLNYVLRADLKDTVHTIQLTITPKLTKPSVLEGFFVIN